MSDFFKKFLVEDPRRLSPSGRYVGLAAFGKHPGWDDHVEDLGLETESLNLAKTVLYVNGIGGQIDSGAWEKLDAAQQLPAFKHVFVWQRSGQILVGRLWSSSDGKGRKRYPMVVCLQFAGVTLGWALKQALPVLAELEAECVKATTAEEVRTLLNRKRAALREAVQSTDGRGEYAPVMPEALHKILQPAEGAPADGFLRVLYQLQSQMAALAPGKFNARANPATIRAQQIRVPVAGENAEQALLFWTRLFQTQVDASVPLLLALPLESGWLDVTAGEPESHEFFCLRASPKAVPLVSEVPYTLDEAFRAKATAFLSGFQRGETTAADLAPAAAVAPAGDPSAPAKGGWLKWLGVGVVMVVGAIAVMLLLPKGKKPEAETVAPEAKSAAPKQVAKSETPAPTPKGDDAAKVEAAKIKSRMDAEAEASRLEDEKKKSDAMASAAKLKSDAEAAAKEKERQMAEAAAKEKERLAAMEKEAARQKDLAEQKRKADEMAKAISEKKKAEEEKMKLAAAAAAAVPKATPTAANFAANAAVRGEFTNGLGMIMVPVSPELWVAKYEVTQAEYQKVMGANPSKSVNERQPVEKVSWNDAQEFCRKLTEMEGAKLPAGKVYTLPTEKQWELFSAGQKFEDLPAGVTARSSPAVVGQTGPANKFGLFDVLGNVWEWCLDDAPGDQKLLKGGAFNGAYYDKPLPPDKQVSNCGFRCVLAAK